MRILDETAETRRETGKRSRGTDTLLHVCAWCLSPSEPGQAPPSEPGQAPSRTTEPVPKQYVDRLSGEHARRNSVSAIAVEAFVNNAG
jgi:hypothetical protein